MAGGEAVLPLFQWNPHRAHELPDVHVAMRMLPAQPWLVKRPPALSHSWLSMMCATLVPSRCWPVLKYCCGDLGGAPANSSAMRAARERRGLSQTKFNRDLVDVIG